MPGRRACLRIYSGGGGLQFIQARSKVPCRIVFKRFGSTQGKHPSIQLCMRENIIGDTNIQLLHITVRTYSSCSCFCGLFHNYTTVGYARLAIALRKWEVVEQLSLIQPARGPCMTKSGGLSAREAPRVCQAPQVIDRRCFAHW